MGILKLPEIVRAVSIPSSYSLSFVSIRIISGDVLRDNRNASVQLFAVPHSSNSSLSSDDLRFRTSDLSSATINTLTNGNVNFYSIKLNNNEIINAAKIKYSLGLNS
jgi:hypothetical protein